MNFPSMNVTPFEFTGHAVRTVIVNGNVWFCAKDVFDALDVKWSGSGTTLRNMPEKWVAHLQHRVENTEKELVFIAEPGGYRVLFRSQKPEAEQFAEWVCEEVLPQIRKTGGFGTLEVKEARLLRSQMIDLANALKGESNRFVRTVLWDQFCQVCRLLGQAIPDETLLSDGQGSLPL